MKKLTQNNSNNIEPLLRGKNVAEFFAGIGLMRLGLEQDGWNIAFANDIEPDKYQMYAANFSDAPAHFVTEDIHKLSPRNVPDVALATASFP
jgi:DNA (cytosine-5)-methyltransferase 1